MQFEGTIDFDVPREVVWQKCLDPHEVGACIPGVEEVEIVTPDQQYRMTARNKLGAISVALDLTVTVTLAEEPERARMKIRGKGSGSHVGASSYIVLSTIDENRTKMDWSFTFTVYGRLATIGQRLIDQSFLSLHREFIDAFCARVTAGGQ